MTQSPIPKKNNKDKPKIKVLKDRVFRKSTVRNPKSRSTSSIKRALTLIAKKSKVWNWVVKKKATEVSPLNRVKIVIPNKKSKNQDRAKNSERRSLNRRREMNPRDEKTWRRKFWMFWSQEHKTLESPPSLDALKESKEELMSLSSNLELKRFDMRWEWVTKTCLTKETLCTLWMCQVSQPMKRTNTWGKSSNMQELNGKSTSRDLIRTEGFTAVSIFWEVLESNSPTLTSWKNFHFCLISFL